MENYQTSAPRSVRNPTLATLADGRRRRVLAVLRDRSGPVAERELAEAVLAREDADAEPDTVRATLRHRHLPKLAEAGLVAWDREEATVTTTDDPALADPHLHDILRIEADGFDDVLACLADRHRCVVLSVLDERVGSVDVSDLAEAVCEEVESADIDATTAVEHRLHHLHLPKLADAGLVSYDPAAGVAAYEGHPTVDDSRLDTDPDRMSRAIVATAH